MTKVAPEETRTVAAEAFLYGYPLVLMDLTRAVLTHVAQPAAGAKAPVNQIGHLREFPDASFTDVVSPNADTLYSISWIDVSAEPMVLAHPDGGERYFLLPLLDGWTDVFSSPGTHTTGADAKAFAIVGPRWSGELPGDVQQIRRECRSASRYLPVRSRCLHPGQQQGRRWPSSSSSWVRRMRRSRVVSCLASSTQQMNSLRAKGVIAFQTSSAVVLAISASRRSAGNLCTTPPGTRWLVTVQR